MPDPKPVLIMLGGATPRVRERLAERFEVIAWNGGNPPQGTDTAVAASVYAGAKCRAEQIDAMPRLKVIGNYGVGYDSVDARHAASKGIIVTHTPDVLNDEVANTAVLLLLATDRKIVEYDRYVRDGRWESEGDAPLTRGVRGRQVGIIGLGRIGSTIAEKLETAFGARIAYHSRSKKDVPYRYYDDLVAMARDCDALIAITPGGPDTSKLVSREVMAALGPEGTLVNVARGSVVDESAMIELLRDGKLGAAGLDVFEAEPSVPQALRDMPHVVLTPHVGSATQETRDAMSDLVVDNIVAVVDGNRPPTPVPECRSLVG